MVASKSKSMGVSSPIKTALSVMFAVLLVVGFVPGMVHATDGSGNDDKCDEMDGEQQSKCDLDHTFTNIGNFIMFLVVAVAVPNGAYGFLEWMTANDSVEKDDRGRRRIRNTFIALGGVGVLRAMVEMMKVFIGGI